MRYAILVAILAVCGGLVFAFVTGRTYGKIQCENAVFTETAEHNTQVEKMVAKNQTVARSTSSASVRDWLLRERARKD